MSQQIDATHVDTFAIFNNNRFWVISLLFAAVNEMMNSAGSGVRLPGCEARVILDNLLTSLCLGCLSLGIITIPSSWNVGWIQWDNEHNILRTVLDKY